MVKQQLYCFYSVEWNPPPPLQLNGFNQGYEIEVRQNGIIKKFEVVRYDEQNPTGRQVSHIDL